MEISLYSDYSFRVLMFLACSSQDLTQIRSISGAYHISENHLIKVVQHLVRLGVVQSVRGRSGGVRLAKNPQEINLGDVFRRTEPNLKLVTCFDQETNTCPLIGICHLQKTFNLALEAFMQVLDKTTLADLIQDPQAIQERLKTYAVSAPV